MARNFTDDMGGEMPDMDASAAKAMPEAQPTKDSGGGSFFISPSDLGAGHECKPGDVLELKVLGTDADGDYEVKFVGKDSDAEPSMAEELRGAVSGSPTGETMDDGDATAY